MLSKLNTNEKENYLLPIQHSEKIVCSYFNNTKRFKVLRITDNRCGLERVVLPRQRIIFEAIADAYLEIHSNEIATAILEDKVCCYQLKV